MNSVAVGNQVDEDELEDELEQMQQEQLDEQMTKTGTVPVSDAVHKLPAAANGPRKSFQTYALSLGIFRNREHYANCLLVKGKAPAVEEDDEEEELRKLQAEMAM
jgi:charged multivesicular body protein 4